MKLIMTLLVRNEQDILRENLEAHLALGVDFFLVMDHGSVDSTPTILADFVERGLAEVFHQSDPGYYQSRWVTWMARRAAMTWQADWVINADADEFWWPSCGDLKTALAAVPPEVGAVAVKRHNFCPVFSSEDHFIERMIYRDTASTNCLGNPLPDKVCHRGHVQVDVAQGNHLAYYPGMRPPLKTEFIEIFHFPIRTLYQIECKISQGGRAYELAPDLPVGLGRTWRYLYRILNTVGLEDYFSSECVESIEQAYSGQSKRLICDTRLRDFMRSRLGALWEQ